jgi:hypothetical protein
MAADALLERGLDEHEQDLLVFPILFCYRHAIELELKDLIYLGQRWAGDRSTVITTHRLPELWKRARAVIESAWPDEDTSQLDAVGRVIGELASVDPEAVQFRYDRDTKGRSRQLPDELMRVDLHKVQAVAGKVIAHLEAAYTGMDEMLQAADFE